MREDLLKDVLQRLTTDYKFEGTGAWLQKGKCPQCSKRELYARREAPWFVRCGRADKCGWEASVRDLYSDIFDVWSNRFKTSDDNPNAAADAYLSHGRGLDLRHLRGAYTQENYVDRDNRQLSSATVRFPLPGGSFWERLIDQPGRFDRKARFRPGASYMGQCWTPPALTIEDAARAERFWFAEGIFDAASLAQAGQVAGSTMSCNNYPEHFLAELRRVAGSLGLSGPELVFAFDVGKAGTEYTRKFVKRAREDGWRATAAQPKPEGESDKLDWNDLLGRERLAAEHIDEYLWNGEILIAENATEKALLIHLRKAWTSFSFVHGSRTWWANFNEARIAEVQAAEGVTRRAAARACANVDEIANCAFRILYFQRNLATDESQYYLRVDTPIDRNASKASFSPASLSAGAEFKKRLLGVSAGAQWLGSTLQLDRLISGQTGRIKTVETLDFTGYSRDHGAWVLGDIAVMNGRVHRVNEEDYFDLGKMSLKLATAERILSVEYDPDRFDTSWLPVVWTAFGTNGLISVAFIFMSLFAEQIRASQKSLPFLEVIGEPGTGKSTLLEFIWKALGRDNYEGFDPQKATAAALARNLGKVANLPVVLIEGDRDEKAPHSKRFEWEELKTAYNGRSVRSRGVKSAGNETYEPPFRGAIIIAQNAPVSASAAILERIMQLTFTKADQTAATKAAAERLEIWPIEDVSGFIVHVIRREAEVMKVYHEAFARHEKELERRGEVRHVRLIKNHAQLAAALDALAAIAPFAPDAIERTRERIYAMAVERRSALSADHAVVQRFWELFDYIDGREDDPSVDTRINRHRKPDHFIAISLPHFEERCRARGLMPPAIDELKRHLKSSKTRRFLKADTVNMVNDRTAHCWVFERQPARKEA